MNIVQNMTVKPFDPNAPLKSHRESDEMQNSFTNVLTQIKANAQTIKIKKKADSEQQPERKQVPTITSSGNKILLKPTRILFKPSQQQPQQD